MDVRDSVSKPFKKMKNRLAKVIHKRKEGSRGDSRQEGGGTDVEESEVSQSSHLHSETEGAVKSGPSREENDGGGGKAVEVNPPTSAPSVSHSDGGEPNGMRTQSSGRPVLDRFFSEHSHPCRSRSRPGDSPSKRERTEHHRQEQIELEVDRVRHSQTVPPRGQRLRRCLRSTQICRRGSLFHSGKLRGKVPSLRMCYPRSLQAFQWTKENEEAIESLAPRVKALSVSLCTSVSEGDFKEQEKRKKLERYVQTFRGRDPSLTDRDGQGT